MGKAKINKKELSHNSTAQHVIGGIDRPNIADVILYFIAGVLFISVLNLKNLWNALNNTFQTTSVDTSTLIDDKLAGVTARINDLLGGRVGQMVFWAIVGCIIYMFIWLIQNIIINLRNDVVADQYVHPKGYKRTSYWEGVIAHKIFFVALLVSFITFIYLSYSFFIPVLSQVFYVTTYNFSIPGDIFRLLSVFILTGLLIYVFVVLGKLTINSYQAIINNF